MPDVGSASPSRQLAPEQLEEYYKQLPDTDAAAKVLADILQIPEYRFDARSAIRLDYASYLLEFAKATGFGASSTAALFTIAQSLLEAVIAGASMTDCQATLQSQLLHMVSTCPAEDSCQLSADQAAKVGRFFAATLFRHFKLYAFVFSHDQAHTEYTADPLVETPVVQPFATALSAEEWEAYNADVAAREQAARQAAEEAENARLAAEQQEKLELEKSEAEARRQAELAKKPATLEEAIEHTVAVRLESEKAILAAAYKAKEDALMVKIGELESKATAVKK